MELIICWPFVGETGPRAQHTARRIGRECHRGKASASRVERLLGPCGKPRLDGGFTLVRIEGVRGSHSKPVAACCSSASPFDVWRAWARCAPAHTYRRPAVQSWNQISPICMSYAGSGDILEAAPIGGYRTRASGSAVTLCYDSRRLLERHHAGTAVAFSSIWPNAR